MSSVPDTGNSVPVDLDKPTGPLYSRNEYRNSFDTDAYLKEFYSKWDAEPAMQVVLQLMPNIVKRLPSGGRLLDVGSGPTVHVAMCFRETKDEIFLSDFAQSSRDEIRHWRKNDGKHFDWSCVARFIALLEGRMDEWTSVESLARQKVKGVLPCNVFNPAVIRLEERDFDVVTTFFCLEAACNSFKEYKNCIKNIFDLIKPGGYFVIGGLMNVTWYRTGGKCYKCVKVTEDEVFESLKLGGLDFDDKTTFRYWNHDDIFVIVGRKISCDNAAESGSDNNNNEQEISRE